MENPSEKVGKTAVGRSHWYPDMIPGTDKIRTYVANPYVYSEESNLENWLKEREAFKSAR